MARIPKPPKVLEMLLPAAHSAVRMARQVARKFARETGVRGESLETLTLVVSELLANAVDHGGGNAALDEKDLSSPVTMQLVLEASSSGWRAQVSDQGGGDPEEVRTRLTPGELPDLDDERGRGFFLMAAMVDEISVERSADGKGLKITAIKRA
ncbi:MAG TPA: ATP-binding protein [Planctomycetota bacterium]|nr:ATP-binding protein [Planctomycetota bacterium]